MNKFYTLTLSIILTTMVTPAHADEWESIGTGRMTDFVFSAHSFKPTTFDVEIEKSTTTEGVYRINEPYANFVNPDPDVFTYSSKRATPMTLHLIQDKYFYFDEFNTGYDYMGWELTASCEVKSHLENFGENAVIAVMPESLGLFDGETFTYGTYYYFQDELSFCLTMGMMYSDFGCNINGEFMISLPGAKDYNCSVTIDSPCSGENKFGFDLTYSSDAAEVRYAILPGVHRVNTDIFDEYIASAQTTDLHHLDIDMDGETDGMYTLFIAVMDDKGNIRSRDSAYFDVYNDDPQSWTAIGIASYTDDIVASAYKNISRAKYDVTVEASTVTPGFYRIVNPYSDPFPGASLNRLDCSDHNHYIIIDATDPERVCLIPSALGIELDYGAIHVTSLAYENLVNGIPEEEIDEMGVWGRLNPDTRAITFPTNALQTSEFTDKGKWYTANRKGAFKLVLPEQSAIREIGTDNMEHPVTYYDLLGRRITYPAPGQIIIRHTGNKIDKIIAR